MRSSVIVLFIATIILFAGCTEMRVEGDAKIFQSSAVGGLIRTALGIALVGLGIASFVSSLLPDRKPVGRSLDREEKLSTMQRAGLAVFGFAMAMLGLGLALVPLLFTKKLHVTVYPDRVEMASTYSQTGGKEVVVPFANIQSVEIRDEPFGIGKFKKFLVFNTQNGREIKQPASNNEMQAVETIQQSLAAYQSRGSSANPDTISAISPASPMTGSSESSYVGIDLLGSIPKLDSPTPAELAPTELAPVDPAKTPVPGGSSVAAVPRFSSPQASSVAPRPEQQSSEQQTGSQQTGSQLPLNPAAAIPRPSVPDRQYSLKRYIINIPVPDDHLIVLPETEVNVGMQLGACYAKRWETVTVVAINDDGTITCNWDNWKAFTYKMMREDLIIAKSN